MSTGRLSFPNAWIIATVPWCISFLARISPTSIYLCGIHWLLSSAHSDLCIFKLILCLECLIYLRKRSTQPGRYFVHEALLHNPSSHSFLSKLLQTSLFPSFIWPLSHMWLHYLFPESCLLNMTASLLKAGSMAYACFIDHSPTPKKEATTVFRPQHLYHLLNGNIRINHNMKSSTSLE